MKDLEKQVRRARRRLTFQQFLLAISWSWFGTLLVAAVLVGIESRWQPWQVSGWWFAGGALAVGTVIALVWTFATRPPLISAAIELDKRFALKERVSSVLALAPGEIETPAGRALVEDAVKRVSKVEVQDRFGVEWRPVSLLPLAPALLAAALAFLPAFKPETVEAKSPNTQEIKVTKIAAKAFRKDSEALKKKAEEAGLKEAPDWMKKLEAGAKELEKKDLQKKDALVELNNLAKEIEKRRDEMGGGEKLKKELNARLQDMGKGPADKFADSISKADFKKAMDELKKLKEQVKQGKLDDKAKKDLVNQLDKMQNQIQKMADNHAKMQKNLEEQIKEARKSGDMDQAEKLTEQLKQMKQQNAQMKKMQDMADKLGQCKQCMAEGKMEDAMQKMSEMQGDLQDMAQNQAEMQMLQDAMDQLADAKNQMNGGLGQNPKGRPGDGLGKGRGFGERPEEEEATNTYDTRVKTKLDTKGSATVVGEVDGPNVQGDFQTKIRTQVEAASKADADPLTNQQLPRAHKEHAREYFNKLRE